MSSFQDLELIIHQLSRAEKAQILQWIVRDLADAYPGIEQTEGIAGGEACIIRTRIPVWSLVQAKRLGMSEADILQSYPSLRAEDLINAWAYARTHQAEINQAIQENEMA